MTLSRKLVTLAAVLVLLAAGIAASADIVVDTLHSALTGTGAVTHLWCDALVTRASTGLYTYSYTLTYDVGTDTVHMFEVQDPNHAAFFGAVNSPDNSGKFTDPLDDGLTGWAKWLSGNLNQNDVRTFSYNSWYRPQEIEVWAIVQDGGNSAMGHTLGMGNTIPEPSTLMALVFGLAGLAPVIKRRRK